MRSRLAISVFNISAILIIVVFCPQSNAKPFFNPFNVAIKTNFAEDGNTFSFVYPRNSQQITFKFKSETINENKFDISGFFSSIARNLSKKFRFFNPFMFTTTTTTTERNLDFSNEEIDGTDSVSTNGSKDGETDSSVSSKENENEITDGGVLPDGHEGYTYSSPKPQVTIEPVNVSYLPPHSTPSYLYEPPN